jgi:DNA-binding MarR family transcriptional regulator
MVENETRPDATTHDFQVSSDGLVRERAVRQTVLRLKERFAEIDELALEAHLMLELTHGVLADMRAAQWAGAGISGRRFPLLRLLYLAERHRLKMGTIAANLGIGTNNTTQLIDGMVRDGLVRRMTDPDDKRVIYAVLTPHGEALFADVFPRNANRVRDAWAPLSDEEKNLLVHLLARVRLNLLSNTDDAQSSGHTRHREASSGTSGVSRKRLPPITTMSQPED